MSRSTRRLAFLATLMAAGGVGSFWIVPRSRPRSDPPPHPAGVDDGRAGPLRFRDMTGTSGVSSAYRNGEEAGRRVILESLGGGAGLFDLDGDGRLDLFLVGGGEIVPQGRGDAIQGKPDRYYHNEGGWRFRDATAEVGLRPTGRFGHGCAAGDFDNDGDVDLVVTGYGGVTLYRNEAGRRLIDVTREVGLDGPGGWCTGAAWADLDGDGRLDLYVVRYVDWSWANNPPCRYRYSQEVDVCSPSVFLGQTDLLYHNDGDGRFSEVGGRSGLQPGGKGLGVVACDLDGDRDTDLYVANDTSGNRLYRNLGEGTFEEVGTPSGAALNAEGVASGSMGTDAADCDGDGDLDLWVSNYDGETNELFRNDGGMRFTPIGMAIGLGAPSRTFVGWGTGLFDFDNDGQIDVFVANGHLMHHLPGVSTDQPPLLFRQLDGRFLPAGPLAGDYFAGTHPARGCAFGDLDDDGDVDIVVVHQNRGAVLLRNDSTPAGHALRLRLEGRASNRTAVGAVVGVVAGGRTLTRAVRGGGSFLSQSDYGLIFGLGEATEADRVEVRWPSGRVDRHERLPSGRDWRLQEGSGPVAAGQDRAN